MSNRKKRCIHDAKVRKAEEELLRIKEERRLVQLRMTSEYSQKFHINNNTISGSVEVVIQGVTDELKRRDMREPIITSRHPMANLVHRVLSKALCK